MPDVFAGLGCRMLVTIGARRSGATGALPQSALGVGGRWRLPRPTDRGANHEDAGA